MIEDQVKDHSMFKKDYFEKIIKLEDQLKDLKHTKKVISTPMLLK